MTPEQVTQAADYASRQTDRWLFIALLIIFFVAIAWLTKWGMRQLDRRDEKIDALQRELGEVRKEQAAAALSQAREFATIIANNTQVIAANSEVNSRKLGILDRIEKLLPVSPAGT